ncbi:hypothetical protein BDQ17DRAFT_1327079 [Cyathus striatus]|nr:hypothetical protein BDQ17DRAFT_1327079 [Cyathus striatus]
MRFFDDQYGIGLKKLFPIQSYLDASPVGDKKIHFWNEPWTGNKFWKLQSELLKESVPLCLLLWSDKGKVSEFGGHKSYPVIARILNLPSEIRNSNGFAGACIIGWLPIVNDSVEHAGKHSWANHHREAACPTCEEKTSNFLTALGGGSPHTTIWKWLWNYIKQYFSGDHQQQQELKIVLIIATLE